MMMSESGTGLSYIQCHDGAYINTEYIPNTGTTTFEFCAAFPEPKFFNFGSYNAGNLSARCHAGAGNANNLVAYVYGPNNYIEIPYDNNYHIYRIFPTGSSVDDIQHLSFQSYPVGISLYLFARNGATPAVPANVTAYLRYAKIYENDILARSFIPAYHNEQYCLYEKIQGKYYYNAAGVGYFTGG